MNNPEKNFPENSEYEISYNYVEKDSQFFTSLEEMKNGIKQIFWGTVGTQKIEDYIIKGIENTQNRGYYLKQTQPEPPRETNPLLLNVQETFSKCYELLKSKNNDYAGEKTQDPYANFRKSEAIGVRTEKGILVRMMDKMSRVSNLIEQDASVKTEKIEDTLEDLINYTAILKSYIKENKK